MDIGIGTDIETVGLFRVIAQCSSRIEVGHRICSALHLRYTEMSRNLCKVVEAVKGIPPVRRVCHIPIGIDILYTWIVGLSHLPVYPHIHQVGWPAEVHW